VVLLCDICGSNAHVKGRCPLLKKAKNMYAMTCGYAMDGLSFYYIPHSISIRPKSDAKTDVIRVIEGEMNALQVKAEMERLVPAKMTWVVEEIDKNRYKTIFPTKGEMHHMIESGMVPNERSQG
jgi:hypothetical protein